MAHLSWPLLGAVAVKSAAGEDGPALEGGGGGVRHLEIDHDLVFGVSESWEPTLVWIGIDGLAERDIEDAEERELEVPKRDCLPSKVDGPGPAGPSLPCIIPAAAAAVAVAAPSCFFFSSASFR